MFSPRSGHRLPATCLTLTAALASVHPPVAAAGDVGASVASGTTTAVAVRAGSAAYLGAFIGVETGASAPTPVDRLARDHADAGSREVPSARFTWPVTPHEVARRFDPPEVVWGAGHRGVDLRSRPGADVVAPGDGVVTFSGSVAGRGVLTLRHRQGFDTTYEPVSHQVSVGTQVRRGDRVATLEPGHCEPACLHWGYKIGPKTYRDPLTLVAPRRPVLLPPL